jgi:hypothetical protein
MPSDDLLAALCAVAVLLAPLALAWLLVSRRPSGKRPPTNTSQEP